MIHSAPQDLVAALGMYNKYIYVVLSLDLVVIRHGDVADAGFANGICRRLVEVLSNQDTSQSVRTES